MTEVTVTREDEISRCVRISIPTLAEKELVLSMEDRDAEELVLVLQGYYRLLTAQTLLVNQERPQQPQGSPLEINFKIKIHVQNVVFKIFSMKNVYLKF